MNGEIISVNDSAMDIKEVTIKLDREIRFLNGQYVMISFEDKSKDRHAYSILSHDKISNTITLLVKAAGEFTKKLMHSKPGDSIFVYGPYGKFTLKKNKKNIFIAGGIGIVPLYSIMMDALSKEDSENYSTHLFYSCRYFHEMALYNELKDLKESDASADLSINFYFTREGGMDRFTVEDIKRISDYSEYDYYICGPDPMMGHIVNNLKAIGIDEKQIYTESFVLENN
ncbi:MAG TPA: FAD-dependent oxidoreductase [Alphaproteobacteria bacterium]|nr:FAD-dependent oxidoreductase [Alphaproteobacteria bacterium]